MESTLKGIALGAYPVSAVVMDVFVRFDLCFIESDTALVGFGLGPQKDLRALNCED